MESLGSLIDNLDVVPKTINSDMDFISITCPTHGLYYKSVSAIKKQDIECPRCQFLSSSRMIGILQRAQKEVINLQEGISDWSAFFKKHRRDPEIYDTPAIYYRLHITHKETGFEFQKIGVLWTLDEKSTGDLYKDFNNLWNPFKWKGFRLETVDKIECGVLEANIIEGLYQREHTNLKITVPNELGFNLNKTYLPDFIWQAKSKTIKPLRDAIAAKQKGKCTVCNRPIKDGTLDHEHIKKVKGSGLIRSTVCSQCNTFIARSENNAARHGIGLRDLPEVLRNMASHLEDQKPIIHPTEVPKRKKVGVRDWNRVRKYYFEVFPGRKTLPKKPTYVTDSWLKLKQAVDNYIAEQKEIKAKKKRTKNDRAKN